MMFPPSRRPQRPVRNNAKGSGCRDVPGEISVDGIGAEGAIETARLIRWMQEEVVTRLQCLDQRLDQVAWQFQAQAERENLRVGCSAKPLSVSSGRSAVVDATTGKSAVVDDCLSSILLHPPLRCQANAESLWRARRPEELMCDTVLLGEKLQDQGKALSDQPTTAESRFGDARLQAFPGDEEPVDIKTVAPAEGSAEAVLHEPLMRASMDMRTSGPQAKTAAESQAPSTIIERVVVPERDQVYNGEADLNLVKDEENCTAVPYTKDSRSKDKFASGGSSSIVQQRLSRRTAYRERVWRFLDEPTSGPAAAIYARCVPIVTVLSIFFTLAQGFKPAFIDGLAPAVVETSVEVLFALELMLRFSVCPDTVTYLTDPHNLVDFVAAAPLAFRAYEGFVLRENGLVRNLLLYLVPILRSMKMLRRFERFFLIIAAFKLCLEALPILMFSLMVIVLSFSSAIYMVEPRDNVESLQKAMWLTIVTMTTVGYGDIVPASVPGSIIVACLVVSSVLYMAMPLGIIGHAFTTVWEDRDRILLTRRASKLLTQWGYKAKDIPEIFAHYDTSGNGELDVDEFVLMLQDMRVGLSEARIVQLFESFDQDGSGSIDAEEFVKAIFPHEVSLFHKSPS